MNRREFNLLAGVVALSGRRVLSAAAIHFEASTKTWVLSNGFFERELVFEPVRGLFTKRFLDKRLRRSPKLTQQGLFEVTSTGNKI